MREIAREHVDEKEAEENENSELHGSRAAGAGGRAREPARAAGDGRAQGGEGLAPGIDGGVVRCAAPDIHRDFAQGGDFTQQALQSVVVVHPCSRSRDVSPAILCRVVWASRSVMSQHSSSRIVIPHIAIHRVIGHEEGVSGQGKNE